MHDLTQKERLVCDGSRIDFHGLSTRAIVAKGSIVRLLDIITDSQKLEILTGNIGNEFIQVYATENRYTKCGPEFGDRYGSITNIVRVSSLKTSAEKFRTILVNFVRTLAFDPSHFNRDFQIQLRNKNQSMTTSALTWMTSVVNQRVPLFAADSKLLAMELRSDDFCSILFTVRILLIL